MVQPTVDGETPPNNVYMYHFYAAASPLFIRYGNSAHLQPALTLT